MRLLKFLLLLAAVHAQAQSTKTYPVHAGESPDMALPQEAKYFFPAFTEGTVFMKDGTSSIQRLNYSKLLDEMQFLTVTGDTLAIANPDLVKNIVIDSSVFYFHKGYLRKIVQENKYTLAARELLMQIQQGKEIGYGASTSTGSITNYSRITSNEGKQYLLTMKRDVLFTTARAYFIGDQYNHFNRADKKGFADMFPRKKDEIAEYIKNEKLNLNNAGDLEKLFRFCTAN
ncbi:MAG: hypothetical protein QM802_14035 [Agriterribacter sp.]